ncbi:MAG: extracellular solute-binding protein [Betaproteobacteria bacterium]|nr:MAG: extracellular solute-binding protein [Betaproteobacteria bacterium]TAG46723.1 MAG: extracellular solute-binding protein [Betaproteobacteria bacterium]
MLKLCAVLAFVAQASAFGAPKITLTVATFPDLDRAAKLAIPGFKKLYPDVDVRISALSAEDHHTAMITALAGGSNLPDVMAIEARFIGQFAESAGLIDLRRAPYNAEARSTQLAKFALAAGKSSKGAMAALPVDVGPGTMFYRADLLAKAQLKESDLTGSWEQFIDAGKKLKASTGAYLVANAVDIKDIYIRASLADGEGIYFDANGKPVVTSPRFEKAFEIARAARQAGIDARIKAWTNEWSEGFRRDRVAAQMMGAWLGGHLQNWIAPQSKGAWRSAPLPNGMFASWGGSFYAIPEKGRHKEMAWAFLQYLVFDKAQQIEAFRQLDAFPSLLEAQSDPFVDQPIEYFGGTAVRQQWSAAVRKIPAVDVDRYDEAAREIVDAQLEKVLDRGKDIKQALRDAERDILRRVRRY